MSYGQATVRVPRWLLRRAGTCVVFKTTQYFRYRRRGADRTRIRDEGIDAAVRHPIKESIQDGGRIRRWTYVDSERRFLRVVRLEDGLTVHNAFFDRGFPT